MVYLWNIVTGTCHV